MFSFLPSWDCAQCGGAAPGAEDAEAGNPNMLALGQGLRDRLEHGVHRILGRRLSDSGPGGHKARDLRLVHPFSPSVAAFSGRPIRPTDRSPGRHPRLARNLRRFDPGSGNSALFLPERRHRRVALPSLAAGLQAFEVGLLQAPRGGRRAASRATAGGPNHVQPYRRHSRAAAVRRQDSCRRPRRHQRFRQQGFTGHDDPAVADRPARATRGCPRTAGRSRMAGHGRAYRSDAARRRAAHIRARHIRQVAAPPRLQVVPNWGRPETLWTAPVQRRARWRRATWGRSTFSSANALMDVIDHRGSKGGCLR